jgi:hypothetical protein
MGFLFNVPSKRVGRRGRDDSDCRLEESLLKLAK